MKTLRQQFQQWLRTRRLAPREGMLALPSGNIWYKLAGHGKGIPLVIIHGGPGFPHDYLESLLPLAHDRPLLLYDQIGCGRSERLDDTSLWNIDTFVNELAALLQRLHIKDYAVLGHSWGAMIALDHALTQPKGLKALILASPIVRIATWSHDINLYRATLPDDVRTVIEESERSGLFNTPAFRKATNAFYDRHVFRVKPWPESYVRAGKGMNEHLYRAMWGQTEFICNGTLKGYDRTDRLKEICIPTLFTCGRHEGARPETLKAYSKRIPGSEVKVFEHSAHLPHLEETSLYLAAIRSFLNR